MHSLILGAGLCALAAALPAAAKPACPAAGAATLERLFGADCPDCWAQAQAGGSAAPGWVFDWIVPAGPDAALAAGALPESAERLQRLGLGAPSAGATPRLALQPAHRAGSTPALRVQSGPAWNGYFGLELRLPASARSRLPAGSTGWLALVERVPAGSDGTPVARDLVRSVAGPLALDGLRAGQPLSHLRALRWPASAEPTRLQARAWIEAPDGTILAVAADQCR